MRVFLRSASLAALLLLVPACGEETVNNTQLGVTQPPAGSLLVLNDENTLFRISPSNPEETESVVVITGLGGATLTKIKYNPLTGQLIGLTEDGRFYLVDPATGHAGEFFPVAFVLPVTFCFDFHPSTGVISLQTSDDDRYFVEPTDGSFTPGNDLTPAGSLIAAAFAPGGTLYGLDITSGTVDLVTISPTSAVAGVGPILAAAATADFDIASNGVAYLVMSPNGSGGMTNLYTLNLGTAVETLLGSLQPSSLRSVTVVP
jgi:hypothetical protein